MMYMVIRYTNCLEPEDYGVNDDWSLILLTGNKKLAEMVQEKEQNNKEFEEYQSMTVKIIEVETEKVYKPSEEIQIGSSFYIE